MSNARYYARRSLGLCPNCAQPAAPRVYCAIHRAMHAARASTGRLTDRAGYNFYMRVYKALGKPMTRNAVDPHADSPGTLTPRASKGISHV